ncbi:MAG: Bax inhibitor-1/YccA family protein, partial [Bacteroidota bacterium]
MSQYFQEKEATHQSGTNPHIASKRMLDDQAASSFMQQVYLTMLIGLGLTGISAWYVGTSPELLGFFYTGILRWIVMLAPLGLVIYLSARFHKMSFNGASTAFAIYSVVNGISLAFIFAIFTTGAIWKVFLITAGTYGAMALLGLLTNIDLSKMGSILYMGTRSNQKDFPDCSC